MLGVGRGANKPSLKNTYVKKHTQAGCLLWRQNNPEVIYSDLRGGGRLFVGETSRSIHREMKMSTWNVRSLYRAGSLKGTLGVDVWIILGWISRRLDVGIWTGLGWPRIETGGGRL